MSQTIRVLKAVSEIHHIIVVSRDSSVLALARQFDVKTIQEEGMIDLNRALKRAALFARSQTADAIIVIPSDLPLIEPGDISQLLGNRKGGAEIIIAPDRRKEGTNALYLSPPDAIDFNFGVDSLKLHIEEAVKKDMQYSIFENTNLGLDIDIPQDLEILKGVQKTTLLEALMFDELFIPTNHDDHKNKGEVQL